MNFRACCDMRDLMKAAGLCDDGTVYVLTHLCHNCGGGREELEAEAARLGFIAAFDGMELEF